MQIETSSYGRIYRLTNKLNGKMYHGQSIQEDINDRWTAYRTLNCKGQKKLYPALKKYGWDNFLAEVIDTTPQDQEQLDNLEIFYIAKFDSMNNGYNCDPGGKGGKKSEETKKKISDTLKGKHYLPNGHTKETKMKMSEIKSGKNNPFFGKAHSEESKKIMSECKKGENGYWFGKIFSNDHKQNLSEAHKGEKNHNFRKPMSEEQKRKISNSRKNIYHTEESKKKMSEARKLYHQRKRELLAPLSPSGLDLKVSQH